MPQDTASSSGNLGYRPSVIRKLADDDLVCPRLMIRAERCVTCGQPHAPICVGIGGHLPVMVVPEGERLTEAQFAAFAPFLARCSCTPDLFLVFHADVECSGCSRRRAREVEQVRHELLISCGLDPWTEYRDMPPGLRRDVQAATTRASRALAEPDPRYLRRALRLRTDRVLLLPRDELRRVVDGTCPLCGPPARPSAFEILRERRRQAAAAGSARW